MVMTREFPEIFFFSAEEENVVLYLYICGEGWGVGDG